MRPIWKGAISFGMVTIPVKLYTATEQKDIRFRLLHKADGAPIEEKRFCTADGTEVAWEDLVRGYEIGKGEFIVLVADRFRPETYTDAYRAALEKLIERRMKGDKRTAKRRKAEPKVIDLMDALKASIAESKSSTRKKPARKRTAKRTAA